MTTTNHIKKTEVKENDIYESKFGKTTPGNIRGLPIFETVKVDFYLDEVNKIIGFNYNEKIFGKNSNNTVQMGIGNQILGILKTGENLNRYELGFYGNGKKYENINEFIKEINTGYSFKLDRILSNKD